MKKHLVENVISHNLMCPCRRCEDCPLLDDIEDDITDEEMELLVNMDYDDFVSSNNKLDG